MTGGIGRYERGWGEREKDGERLEGERERVVREREGGRERAGKREGEGERGGEKGSENERVSERERAKKREREREWSGGSDQTVNVQMRGVQVRDVFFSSVFRLRQRESLNQWPLLLAKHNRHAALQR